MTKPRADLGFGAELETFDPEAWAPSTIRPGDNRPSAPQLLEAARAAGFRSREPEAQPAPPPVRRRRTGRNTQFNIKARPETIAAFCAIADEQGWGIGETLEHAVELLEREFRKNRERSARATAQGSGTRRSERGAPPQPPADDIDGPE